MTETPEGIAQARLAQARGEAAAAAGDRWAENMQQSISGSQVMIDPAPEQPDKTAA